MLPFLCQKFKNVDNYDENQGRQRFHHHLQIFDRKITRSFSASCFSNNHISTIIEPRYFTTFAHFKKWSDAWCDHFLTTHGVTNVL